MKYDLIKMLVMRQGSIEIVSSIIYLFLILLFFENPTFPFIMPVTFIFLFGIVTGLFEFREYYNKVFYSVSIVLLLVTLWMVYFSLSMNNILFFIENVIITLIIVSVFLYTLRTWSHNEKIIKRYNNMISKDPANITTLNNRCVELASQRKYLHATMCFDKVLEIDSNDAAVLYNKSIMLKKERNHDKSEEYRYKALKLDPGLKKSKENGKMILSIKGMRVKKSSCPR